MSVYIIDSNCFIQAHRLSYPLDIAYSFWGKMKELASDRKMISIDKVKSEIYRNEDVLKKWCDQNLENDFFKDTKQEMKEYDKVVKWAMSKKDHYIQRALQEFLDADVADAFIVAYALADPENRVVVTFENSEPTRKNKVKIPDACIALNVNYVNIMDMFRQLGVTF